MEAVGQYFFIFITVYSIIIELEAVTVNPILCPINKMSPSGNQGSSFSSPHYTGKDSLIRNPRTLDLIYDLLGPGRPRRQLGLLKDLQEQPQEAGKDGCGEREGFDKEDLSIVTQNGFKKNLERQDRKYTVYNKPPYKPGPAIPPTFTLQRPQSPTGPPSYLKGKIIPVWENILEPSQADYRPGLIGGPLGYIVGFSSQRPPTADPPTKDPITERPLTEGISYKKSPIRFPEVNSGRQKKTQEEKSTITARMLPVWEHLYRFSRRQRPYSPLDALNLECQAHLN